jgi:hypothetical protein
MILYYSNMLYLHVFIHKIMGILLSTMQGIILSKKLIQRKFIQTGNVFTNQND